MAQSDAAKERAALIPVAERGVQLSTYQDLWSMVAAVHKSGMAPRALNSPEKILVAAQYGMEAGLSFLQSLSSVEVIEGTPGWKNEVGVGFVRAAGGKIRFGFDRDEEGVPCRGWCKTTRDGEDFEFEFTRDDATRAGLWGKKTRDGKPTTWILYPGDMLQWKAVGRALKNVWPDKMHGLPLAHEVAEVVDDGFRVVQSETVSPPREAPGEPDPLQVQLEAETAPSSPEPEGEEPIPEPDFADYDPDDKSQDYSTTDEGKPESWGKDALQAPADEAAEPPPPAEEPLQSDSVDLPPLKAKQPCPACERAWEAYGHHPDCPYYDGEAA